MPLFASLQSHPNMPRLLGAVLLVGAAEAITGPYIVLFGSDRAHLSDLQIGVFVSMTALSGIGMSTWLGRRYDARPSRAPLIISIALASVGYLCLTWVTSFLGLLVIAVGLLGSAAAAYPQIFTLAHSVLEGDPSARSSRYTAMLRSLWSIAWAIGPVLGGVVLAHFGFSALFLITATLFALVALPVARLGSPSPRRCPGGEDEAGSMRPVTPMIVSMVLFHLAMFSGSVVLPLYVTRDLHFSTSDVGVIFSICAAAEVVAALALMSVAHRMRNLIVIQVGTLLLGLQFALLVVGTDWPMIVLSQIARGVGITAVGAAGIAYMQHALPGMTGRATTMFSNAGTAGSLAAGVVAGATAQLVGYRAALLVFGALCVVAWLLILAARQILPSDTASPRHAVDA